MTENVTLGDSPENVTVWNTNTPRIEQKCSGGPENVTLWNRSENVTLWNRPENVTLGDTRMLHLGTVPRMLQSRAVPFC